MSANPAIIMMGMLAGLLPILVALMVCLPGTVTEGPLSEQWERHETSSTVEMVPSIDIVIGFILLAVMLVMLLYVAFDGMSGL